MSTLRTSAAVLGFAFLSLPTSGRAQSDRLLRVAAADPIAIPMTADRWETKENALSPIFAAGAPGRVPKLGEKAPPFSLQDLDGQRVTLEAELTHGPVVLVLLRGWPGYQCPFCTRQFADFLGHASAFEAAGARVVWVYPGPSDSVQQHAREFLASRPLPSAFRITTDPDYGFTNAYGLRWDAPQETAYPATFVIDRGAIIRFAQISVEHGGRSLAADVLKVLEKLPR